MMMAWPWPSLKPPSCNYFHVNECNLMQIFDCSASVEQELPQVLTSNSKASQSSLRIESWEEIGIINFSPSLSQSVAQGQLDVGRTHHKLHIACKTHNVTATIKKSFWSTALQNVQNIKVGVLADVQNIEFQLFRIEKIEPCFCHFLVENQFFRAFLKDHAK